MKNFCKYAQTNKSFIRWRNDIKKAILSGNPYVYNYRQNNYLIKNYVKAVIDCIINDYNDPNVYFSYEQKLIMATNLLKSLGYIGY